MGMMKKYKVAFVCTGNSFRSQMAEGWARHLGSDLLEVCSAGTNPAGKINLGAIEAMKEVGIDISGQYPKTLDVIPDDLDILITMGCGTACPFAPSKYKEDWALEDPAGEPAEVFRQTRNIIKQKVETLVEKVRKSEVI